MVAQRTLTTSLFFLIVSLLITSIRGQVVVSPYDWFQIGAYAKYTSASAPDGLIFPNGTLVRFLPSRYTGPTAPAILEWTIIDKADSSVSLNVTFSVSCENVTFHKVLLLDANIYTRDTVIDGESIGKTCFWAEPYAGVGQKIALYGKPPDQIGGIAFGVAPLKILQKETKGYFVDVPFQSDPCVNFAHWPRFNWHTAMAEIIVLVCPRPVALNEEVAIDFNNGTTYRITRFLSTPLGEKLCVYALSATYPLQLNETNVRTGPNPEDETASDIGLVKCYPYIFVGAVTISTLAFMISYRSKHKRTGKH